MKKIGEMKVISTIFVLLSNFLFGQVSVEFLPNKKEFSIDEIVELTLILEGTNADLSLESITKFPDLSKFYEKSTGISKKTMIESQSGLLINQLVYNIALIPKELGVFKIGSVMVKINGKTYKTLPFEIHIMEENANYKNFKPQNSDVFFQWEISENQIFTGQLATIELKAYSRDINHLMGNHRLEKPFSTEIDFFPFFIEKNDLQIEQHQNHLFSRVVEKFHISANTPGQKQIPITHIQFLEQKKIKIPSTNLYIKALPPAPKKFNNAIGDFHFEYHFPKNEVKKGQAIHLGIKLQGEGNLSPEMLPKIKENDFFTLLKPKITENFTLTEKGRKGEIEIFYTLISNKLGQGKIELDNFVFFNPEKQQFEDFPAKEFDFYVLDKSEESLSHISQNQFENLDKNHLLSKNQKKEEKNQNNKMKFWIFGGGLLFLGCFFAFLKIKSKPKENFKIAPTKEKVEDLENEIREQMLGDKTQILSDLNQFLESSEYSPYLSLLNYYMISIEKKIMKQENKSFLEYLKEKDVDLSNQYQKLLILMQEQKFCPIQSEEVMKKIHQKVENIFGNM